MRTLMILAGLLLTSGCATAIQGTTEAVTFVSDPNGAQMTTDTGHRCTTPCTIEIDRNETFRATFTLNGETQSVDVATDYAEGSAATIAGTALGAPLLIAPVALAVDAASGALLTHVPNPVKAVFKNQVELRDRALGQTATARAAQTTTTPINAATGPSEPAFPPVPGSPPLYEGASYAAFTEDQIAVYCTQSWTTRAGPDGRTEYNPCSQRSAFR